MDEVHGEQPVTASATLSPVGRLNAHPSTPALAEQVREIMAHRICELHVSRDVPMRLDAAMSLPDVLTTLAWEVARELQRENPS